MTNYFALILLPIVISLVGIHGRTLNVSILNSETNSLPAHCNAFVQTKPLSEFYGASGESSLYKPMAQGNQWSTSRIKLTSGSESIEAGWMVYPSLLKDNDAHLYVLTGARSSVCINLACPGFVEVSKGTLGSVPEAYSTIGGQQFSWVFSIDKHQDDGNWWLFVSWGSTPQAIGYWPRSIFSSSLADSAAQVSWGGDVGNPNAVEPAPIMGNGRKPGSSNSAFFEHVTVTDKSLNKVQPRDTEEFNDCDELYMAADAGDKGPNGGRVIVFGGSE